MRDRVLVVDDERDCADTLAVLIRAFGCQAKAVYDGAEAIKQVGQFLPDMVLVDIGMPGLNGYDTVAQLRKQRGNEYLIVVAVTGWAREEYKRRAYDCGFDLFITKPISYETLKDLLTLSIQPPQIRPGGLLTNVSFVSRIQCSPHRYRPVRQDPTVLPVSGLCQSAGFKGNHMLGASKLHSRDSREFSRGIDPSESYRRGTRT